MAVKLIQSNEPIEKRELAVHTAGDILQHLVLIRANLPKKIAGLIEEGENEKAIAAMLAWGKGTKPLDEIWMDVAKCQNTS